MKLSENLFEKYMTTYKIVGESGINSYLNSLKNEDNIAIVKKDFDSFKYDNFYEIISENEIKKYVDFYGSLENKKRKSNTKNIAKGFLFNGLKVYYNFIIYFKQFNKIFYGVPGVGKSYKIKQAEGLFEQEKTVFHPEYTNADFVGQLLPVKNKREDNTSNNADNKQSSISYEFVPGPFTTILAKAHKDPEGKYMLVIDEINRGNSAAIFGEIFQLLDRDESGKSEFGISNKDIYDYLIEKEGVDKSLLPDEKIYLPSNLYIWATMNTSDQNVYTLDTAFQRRWQMEMLTIDFDKDDDTKAQGEIPITNSNNKLTWREFVTAINAEISNRNEGMISVEDKRIGPWFAKKNEIEDKNLFTQKVIKYLWDDAFKMSRTEVFRDVKTLDEIVDKINKGSNIEGIFDEKIFEKVINDRKESLQNGQETNEIEDTNE